VLGVDDWAKCKGVDYGTVLIDIERGRVLELLSDRKAETLSQWLQANPGVEIICRDRAQAYAEGASAGAPDAVQVADRFHLLGNLAEALQRIFESHQKLLLRVGSESEAPPIITDEIAPQDFGLKEDGPASNTLVLPSVDLTPAGQVRRAQRRQNYEQVKTLFAQGWTKRAIARHLDMSRTTVQRYIQTENFRERQCPASKLDPYKAHLLQRWNAGCRTGTLLYNEIVQIGYCGQRSHVLAYITRLRKAQGLSSRSRLLHPGHEIRDPAAEVLTPRQATWLVLRPEEKLKDEDRAQLAQLIQADVHLKETITLTQDFAHMLRERQGEKLEAWLHRAERSSMAPMRGFVRGLRRDYDAVKAGLTLPWSSGPVEGQINRLKLIKRQMYGRAKIDLLEKRVVQVA
jgi:DNA-binding NarL/FixJ family response regulator